jgi:hypothetical protein
MAISHILTSWNVHCHVSNYVEKQIRLGKTRESNVVHLGFCNTKRVGSALTSRYVNVEEENGGG